IAVGSDPGVIEEISRTLAIVEKYRSTILEEENRNSFFDAEQSAYDLAIGFQLQRARNAVKAFEYSENSRSRSLLDLVKGDTEVVGNQAPDIKFNSTSHPLTLLEVQQEIPGQIQILQYAVLSDDLVIWVISKDHFSFVEKHIGDRQLMEKIQNYVQ